VRTILESSRRRNAIAGLLGALDANGKIGVFDVTDRETPTPAPPAPFLVTDQAGNVLPATITVHAATPLVAVEYVGDCSARIIVAEHDLVEVARRFRQARPKAVTTVRPIRTRRVVATIVVDVPDAAGAAETAGDRREPSQQLPRADPGHLAGVGLAERLCKRSARKLDRGPVQEVDCSCSVASIWTTPNRA